MNLRSALAVSSVVLAWAQCIGTVRADEAYVCEGNKIVYVKPGQLEELKRTNACIAGYYNLEVEPAATDKSGAKDPSKDKANGATPAVPAGGAAKGLQLEREVRAQQGKPAVQSQDGQDKPLLSAVTIIASPSSKQTSAVSPAATSDYRNVIIINAAPGSGRTFRHDR